MITSLDEASVCLAMLSGRTLRPYSTRDFGREEYSEARSVIVAESKALELVDEMRSKLGPGLVAFIGTCRNLSKTNVRGVEVVVGSGENQFDILRIAATDACNYGLTTECLIARLRAWDQSFGLDIFHAETDTIQFRFKSMPSNLKTFTEEVYEFCPDIVEQGSGTIEGLASDIIFKQRMLLWWD